MKPVYSFITNIMYFRTDTKEMLGGILYPWLYLTFNEFSKHLTPMRENRSWERRF